MVGSCRDWIKGRKVGTRFNRHLNSSCATALVANRRRASGHGEPFIFHGAFVAAAVGLGLDFKFDGASLIFKFANTRRELQERVDAKLASCGQRLVGVNIVQTHDGPWMTPCKRRIVQQGVDLDTLAFALGVL